jgi:class 3 adenylate cyclase
MDYFGRTVNKAARIANIAHGGQVVMSEEAYRDLSMSAAQYRFTDLGEVKLKSIEGSTRIFQVLPKVLERRQFPPLRIQRDNAEDKLFTV